LVREGRQLQQGGAERLRESMRRAGRSSLISPYGLSLISASHPPA
jgi:hypothetical protein